LVARAAIDGIQRGQAAAGVDIGEAEAPPVEELPAEFKGIEAPRGEPDDLKRINGITPKLEQRLNDLGVFHYWQLADLDPATLRSLDRQLKLKGQVEQEDWVGQARKLVEAAAA